MKKVFLFAVSQCFHLIVQSTAELPSSIDILGEYQKSFVEQEHQLEMELSKEKINGPRGDSSSKSKPLLSPLEALNPTKAAKLVNRTVEPYEWILTFTGTDLKYALIVIFIILPYIIAFFVLTYIVRPFKPELVFKRNEEFPIIPLMYLQETKAEQRITRPKRNSIEWVATRYLIMASDNVANLKMLDYDDKESIKDRKHHGWFILRLLAKFNALYTRHRVDIDGNYFPTRQPIKMTQLKTIQNTVPSPLTEDEDENDATKKISELLLLKRIRNYEKKLDNAEDTESEARRKTEYEGYHYRLLEDDDDSTSENVSHAYSSDESEVDERRIRKTRGLKQRTSLEIMREGYRQAIINPLNTYRTKDLRSFPSEDIQNEYWEDISSEEDNYNQKSTLRETYNLHDTQDVSDDDEVPSDNLIGHRYHEWEKEKHRHRHLLDRPEKVEYRKHSLRRREEKAAEKLRWRRNSKEKKRRRSHDIPTKHLEQHDHQHRKHERHDHKHHGHDREHHKHEQHEREHHKHAREQQGHEREHQEHEREHHKHAREQHGHEHHGHEREHHGHEREHHGRKREHHVWK